ncbi:MAG: hypothetical protein IPI07_16010 [Flavobacteriales bacterium]|nr:hypothetical protein [Flavobacteriales bacterium]
MIWSNAAVGFVGSGANTANVLYVAMVAIPFIGGVVSRLKARGLCITMILTAAVQAAITVFAFASGLVSEEESSVIVAISAVFILLWIGSAVLFQQAAEREHAALETRSSFGRLRRSPIQFVLSMLLMAIGAVLLSYDDPWRTTGDGPTARVPAGHGMVLYHALPIEGISEWVVRWTLVEALTHHRLMASAAKRDAGR